MPTQPRAMMVENVICEAYRLSRDQELHQKRLDQIHRRPKTADPNRPWLESNRPHYSHLQPGRRTPLADAERALRMRRDNAKQTERLEKLKTAEPEFQRQRAIGQQVATGTMQRRVEMGRLDLNVTHARQRRENQTNLAKENAVNRQRIRQAKPIFASESTIRTLRGEAARPSSAK
tara:strand:+ start:361 stop:888 length:528 start_codon:yes stop_codon:yes gene_type:complete